MAKKTVPEIGTAWLLQPARNPHDGAAWGKTIAEMDLKQLKPFMCPKSGGNPQACTQCQGFKQCSVGQRALRLHTEETQPVFTRRWTAEDAARPEKKQKLEAKQETADKAAPTLLTDLSTDQEALRAACESGNAWNWIMEQYRMSKNAAGDLLMKLIRRCPNIAAEYGGSRRIMQRPKAVTITALTDSPAAEATADTGEPADAPEPGQAPEETPAAEQEAEEAPDSNTDRKNRARQKCADAVASGDVVKYLEGQGLSPQQITKKMSRWRETYPDLMADVPKRNGPMNPGAEARKRSGKAFYEECSAQPDPVAYYAEKRGVSLATARDCYANARRKYAEPETEAAAYDDTVSVADFLAEYGGDGGGQLPADMPEPEPEPEPPPREPEAAQAGDSMLDMLKAKYAELKDEKNRLRAEIRRMEERIRCIEEQQDALARTLSAFGSTLPEE